MRKVLILSPRLDCSFKEGPVPEKKGPPNAPLRVYWERFIDKLSFAHLSVGDRVAIHEKALWQFKPEDYQDHEYDLIYIPHKHKFQFDVGPAGRYYMQMVFPDYFQIDTEGWCAGASSYDSDKLFEDIGPVSNETRERMKKLEERFDAGISKFPQGIAQGPARLAFFDVFMPLQIPHDETIKYHSNISVAEALEQTLTYCAFNNKSILIKPHPVNMASMGEFYAIVKDYSNRFKNLRATWAPNIPLTTAFENSHLVVTVNSGVGMEAMLKRKIVANFGRVDYQYSAFPVKKHYHLEEPLQCVNLPEVKYEQMFERWFRDKVCVDEREDFNKLVS